MLTITAWSDVGLRIITDILDKKESILARQHEQGMKKCGCCPLHKDQFQPKRTRYYYKPRSAPMEQPPDLGNDAEQKKYCSELENFHNLHPIYVYINKNQFDTRFLQKLAAVWKFQRSQFDNPDWVRITLLLDLPGCSKEVMLLYETYIVPYEAQQKRQDTPTHKHCSIPGCWHATEPLPSNAINEHMKAWHQGLSTSTPVAVQKRMWLYKSRNPLDTAVKVAGEYLHSSGNHHLHSHKDDSEALTAFGER